jgi:hypothetical protein
VPDVPAPGEKLRAAFDRGPLLGRHDRKPPLELHRRHADTAVSPTAARSASPPEVSE